MGHAPPKGRRLPTLLERLRGAYISGSIEIDEFEARVASLLASGHEDRRPPLPPPRPGYHGMGTRGERR